MVTDLQLALSDVVEGLSEGILVNDPSGVIVYVNDALARMLGRSREEMLGLTIFDFMDDAGRALALRKLAERAEGTQDRFNFRWERPDHTGIWTQVSTRPAIGPDGEHLGSLVAITDITAHIELEAKLRDASAELENRVEERTVQLRTLVEQLKEEVQQRAAAQQQALAANGAKDGFLANMSHELRTPLTAILGYTELTLEEPELTVAEVLDDLTNVHRSAAHLLTLIDDLLDLSKIEAGAIDVEHAPYEPNELLQQLAAWIAPDLAKRSNRLEMRLDPLPLCLGDERRVRQIVLNLLSNANKFARGTILLRATTQEGSLVITVVDQGPGIDPLHHERVFQPFERSVLGGVDQPEGTGLGLAISRAFARAMGGNLTLSSTLGKGATFELVLPCEPSTPRN